VPVVYRRRFQPWPKLPALFLLIAFTSGLGVVTLNGRDIYLGAFGTEPSREKCNRLIAEWLATGRMLAPAPNQITIVELIAAFMQHAHIHYRKPDGTLTSEVDNYRQAFRPLKKLYSRSRVCDFGPKSLRAVQQEMAALGWCRTNINKQINRLRCAFKWAVAQEMIDVAVYQSLQTVAPLKRGRCSAKESDPVNPVPDAHILMVKPYVSRQVWALIQCSSSQAHGPANWWASDQSISTPAAASGPPRPPITKPRITDIPERFILARGRRP
jgi:hypothetical protein